MSHPDSPVVNRLVSQLLRPVSPLVYHLEYRQLHQVVIPLDSHLQNLLVFLPLNRAGNRLVRLCFRQLFNHQRLRVVSLLDAPLFVRALVPQEIQVHLRHQLLLRSLLCSPLVNHLLHLLVVRLYYLLDNPVVSPQANLLCSPVYYLLDSPPCSPPEILRVSHQIIRAADHLGCLLGCLLGCQLGCQLIDRVDSHLIGLPISRLASRVGGHQVNQVVNQ